MRRTAAFATALAAALAASPSAGAAGPTEVELLRIDDSGFSQDGLLAFTPVEIDAAAARAAIGTGRVLRVPHPDGGVLEYRYLRHVEHANGTLTWIGRSANAIQGREAILTVADDLAVGSLPVDGGGTLELVLRDGQVLLQQDLAEAIGGTSALEAPDTSAPPQEAIDAQVELEVELGPLADAPPAPGAQRERELANEPQTVDVLLAYTSEFARAQGTDMGAVLLLQNRIDQGNQALANGQVNLRYRLVATARVDFDDTSANARTNSDALSDITYWGRTTATPLALRLHTLRHRHGADIVGLVRRFDRDQVSCGNGWVGGYQGNNIANYVNFGYFTASVGNDGGFGCRPLTIGHEIGHNLGQTHNLEDADNTRNAAHPYSHGWRDNPAGQTRGFFTMMAYSAANQDQAITVSTPLVSNCKTAPCGTAEDDVARSLNQTMPLVAAWIPDTDGSTRQISGQRGHFDLRMDGLPALTNARWRAEFAGGGTITVTGPTTLPAGATAVARVAWDALPVGTTALPVRIVAESSPGVVAGFRDISVVRRAWSSDNRAWQATERMLHDNVPAQVVVGQWASNRLVDENRLFFPVPPGATEVTVTVTAPVDVDVFAGSAAIPGNGSNLLGLGTSRTAPIAADTGASLTKTLVIGGNDLPQGLLNLALLRPNATSLSTTTATVTVRVTGRSAAPALTAGQYFNPARDGHGLFIDPAGNDWVGVWYTYLEDSTPTWYYLQGPAPGASGVWNATLYRAGWNGSSAHLTAIGDVGVTPTSATSMVMSYNIDGESGVEPMIQLGGTGCPTSGGAPLRGTGHWFSPARSGFGYSAQYEPDQEIYAAYLYDDQGRPRWLLAQAPFNEVQINFPTRQYLGSCPLCGHMPTSSQQTGTLTRTLGTNADGQRGLTNVRLAGNLAFPLSGSWSQDFPTALLSTRRTCP